MPPFDKHKGLPREAVALYKNLAVLDFSLPWQRYAFP